MLLPSHYGFQPECGHAGFGAFKESTPPLSLSLKDKIKFLMLFYFMNLIDKFTNRKK